MKTVLKILLICVGGLMLLGGGICTATNALFLTSGVLGSGPSEWVVLYVVLGGISAAIAAAGFFLIKVAGTENDDAQQNDADQ